MRQIVRGDAGAGVLDGEPDPVAARRVAADAHGATARRVSERIAEQVGQDLPDSLRVGLDDRRRAGLRGEGQRHAGLRGVTVERGDNISGQLPEIDRSLRQAEARGLGGRERPEILDQARERLRLLERQGQMLVVARIHAVEHPLERALQHRERRAQLVRDVRQQIAALLVLALQPLRHRVERLRERPAFGRSPLGDAGGEITVRGPPERRHHVLHRARHPAERAGTAERDAEHEDYENDHQDVERRPDRGDGAGRRAGHMPHAPLDERGDERCEHDDRGEKQDRAA